MDSHPESLGEARRRIFDAMRRAGLGVDAARNMEVAAGEALSNTYQHAYAGGIGPVFVEVASGAGVVTVLVSDEGRATETPVVPWTLPPRTNIGGRGLYMMSRLVDDIALGITDSGHGLTVRISARVELSADSTVREGRNSGAGLWTGHD